MGKKQGIAVSIVVWSLCLMASVYSGERLFSFTGAPPQGGYIGVNLGVYSLGKYLNELQVNRPEVLNEVKEQLKQGRYYHKRTMDQKARSTQLTVYVTPEYMLTIRTYRNDTCPDCNGAGHRDAPFDKFSRNVAVKFRCLTCDATGIIPNNTTEKFFILSSEDFENPEEGRRLMAQKAYAGAPQGAQAWVERLASQNPRDRLEACLWLDQNYVRTGMFFQDIMPMLNKARYHDSNAKQRIMVWQFWAGKDIARERDRAYYRIYADTKTGKITKKGFYSGN